MFKYFDRKWTALTDRQRQVVSTGAIVGLLFLGGAGFAFGHYYSSTPSLDDAALTASPTPTPSPSASPQPSASPEPSASASPKPKASTTPSPKSTAKSSSSPATSPKPSATPTASPQTTASPSPSAASTPSPSPSSNPNAGQPPKMKITYPTEGQSITFTSSGQQLCVVDVPDGGDTSGLQRKHNTGSGWSSYANISTLCYVPPQGANTIQLQYKNGVGQESGVYTINFTFAGP